MSASAATISVGTLRPRTSSLKSKSFAIDSPILSSSRPKSSGRGATRWYSWYIGVSFMNSAAVGADLPLLGEHLRVDRVAPDVGRDRSPACRPARDAGPR